MKVDPEVSRTLAFAVTYDGTKRPIKATLAHGDRLVFEVEGLGVVGSVDLKVEFWASFRNNAARKKHPLQPRVCAKPRAGNPAKVPATKLAKQYGVSRGQITKWRKSGAPLSNPDAMGEYIFALPKRGGTRTRKKVLA
jgi:hypothetical protein